MNAETELLRWKRASKRAGELLMGWWKDHPIILNAIAPLLPRIARVLVDHDIDKIEDLLREAER